MVNFQEAREIVFAQARSWGTEEVLLDGAFGRVLAETVLADRDYPPFPRATMDGYALRYADLERGVRRFRVADIVFAGSRPAGQLSGGECYKIMTGAAVPGDADMVVRREDVGEGEAEIEVGGLLPDSWRPFLNIARQGEDLRAGDLVIDKPCRVSPAVMGLLATLGRSTVKVARAPRVGLVTTGNEVVEPGGVVSLVQIRNSNRWMLMAALREQRVEVSMSAHAVDDPEQLTRDLQRFLDMDILIITGGVSAGDADHVPAVLEQLGVRRLFHKIAMRPGKPTWCGVSPRGGMVFALPGNPFSCFVNFALLIAPFIHACWGLERTLPMALPLGAARRKRTPLDEFFPVRVEGSPAMLTQMPLNGSGDIRMGMQANALALHPATAGDLERGALVAVYSFV
jgi:molybdopterin molybdotransferase